MNDSANSTSSKKGILVLDIDGTLAFGNPQGEVTPKQVAQFKKQYKDWKIIALSRKVWNAKTREKLQELGLDGLYCEYKVDDPISLHPRLIAYRKAYWLRKLGKDFPYHVYVGDRESDEKASKMSNFLFLHAKDFKKVLK